MEEIRSPEESYTDRLQHPDEAPLERDLEMESAMIASMKEYEEHLANDKLRKERDRIKKYAGDCVIQKAVLLMIDYKLNLKEKSEVSSFMSVLLAEGRLEDVYRYLEKHIILPANYIGIFL
tara:strand:+ start:216 stop:578 length:363 start_codon:yes stop_codon:yes gene_type:complete